MVVRLQLAMHGARNSKFFHLVALNSGRRRDSKPIELLGVYNPRAVPGITSTSSLGEKTRTVDWSVERIKYWLGVGAVPSKPAVRLFKMGGILSPEHKHYPKPKETKSYYVQVSSKAKQRNITAQEAANASS